MKWPGTEKDVGILYLNCAEAQEAYFAARDWFEKRLQKVDTAASTDFMLEERYQTCFRLLVDPELGNPQERIFASAKQCRETMTPNEAEYFLAKHQELQEDEAKQWYAEPEKENDGD